MTKKISTAIFIWLILAGIFFCSILNSCSKVSVDLGTDFVDNSTTNLVLVDSTTLEISTVYVDSFSTSAGGSILAGSYTDPQFGKIKSNSFVQLGAPAAHTIPNGAVFDSLEVILKLNKTFYGDTLSSYNIAIHQLKETIKLPDEQTSFFNNNKLDYNATALGSTSAVINPSTRDTIAVRISQALGQELFDKMFTSNEVMATDAQFVDYFKGLSIVAGDNNNLLLGFKDSLTMRLHYRSPGVINTDATIDFPLNTNTNQFNNITADRTGTPIAAIGAGNKQIFSAQSQNAGYSQYISGVMAKIRLPYLRNILQLNDYVKIIRADLVIKPVKNSFTSYYALPPNLRLSTTDQYNLPGADLTAYVSSTGAYNVQYGSLYIDQLYGNETAYTYDVTAYLQAEIAKTDNNKDGLLVLPPGPTQTFNRIMIGDRNNPESKSQVKIYYATVK
jgi:hypothetical protein